MDDRLKGLISTSLGISKRDVVLNGIQWVLDACEKTPQDTAAALRVGAYKTRYRVALIVTVPVDLDDRLRSS